MNIVHNPFSRALLLPLLALGLSACDMNSVDSTSAVISDSTTPFRILNFSGLYMNPDNDSSTNGLLSLVFPNESGNKPSGQSITSLRLLQYGSVLEGYDSANQTWSGKISSLSSETATFSLQGRTTAGISVELAGTMVYKDQQSTMDATWIEPSFYGTLIAQATVSPATTNTPVSDLTISPTSVSLSSSNSTTIFTATGGTGSYTWSHNNSCGKLSATTGSSITYTWLSVGTDYVTVTSGTTETAIVTCK